MSIINEALRKVQTKRQPEDASVGPSAPTLNDQPLTVTAQRPSPQTPPAPENPLCQPRSLFPGRLIVILPIVLLLVILGKQLSSLFPQKMLSRHAPAPTQDLVVSGVVSMADKKMVLINNEIYEVGDVIDGMTLMGITTDSVQLLKDGKIQDYKVRK